MECDNNSLILKMIFRHHKEYGSFQIFKNHITNKKIKFFLNEKITQKELIDFLWQAYSNFIKEREKNLPLDNDTFLEDYERSIMASIFMIKILDLFEKQSEPQNNLDELRCMILRSEFINIDTLVSDEFYYLNENIIREIKKCWNKYHYTYSLNNFTSIQRLFEEK